MTAAAITFGTALRSPRDIAASARDIEALGYDVLGCGRHVSFHGETANAFISLAVAAGVTSRIRLMSTITLAPLYPPAPLASSVPRSTWPLRRVASCSVSASAAGIRRSSPPAVCG